METCLCKGIMSGGKKRVKGIWRVKSLIAWSHEASTPVLTHEGHPAGSETLCRAQDGTGHRHLLAFTKMKYKYPSIRTVTTLAGQYYEARPQTWVAADRRQTKTLTFRGPLRIMCRPCIQCYSYLKSSQPTFVASLLISLCQLRLGLSLGTQKYTLGWECKMNTGSREERESSLINLANQRVSPSDQPS